MNNLINKVLQAFLGLAFLVFGLNKLIGFLPFPEMPSEANAFFGALVATGYMIKLIAFTEILGGTLVLFRLFSALGLVLLMPVSVNIVLFHILLAPAAGIFAFVLAGLNVYLLFVYLPKFQTLLAPR